MIGQLTRSSFTTAGKWGFLLTVLMIFSYKADLRISIAGLLVHPYLLALPLAYLFSSFTFSSIPQKVTIPLVLFFAVFSFASLQNLNPISEIFKVGASVVTFLFFAYAVKSEKDFEWMGWGLILCAVTIGIQGFLLGEKTESLGDRLAGINVLEGIGNKNAQSLFTLPGVFLGSYMLIKAIGEKRFFTVIVLVISLFFIVISIFLSANRSGWLGLSIIMISIVFVSGLRFKTIAFSIILCMIGYIAIENYAASIVERKRRQTTEGYKSDEGRKMLIVESLAVGLENPLIGVGMDELHHQMAVRLGLTRFRVDSMDTHFLPGYLIGASGVLSLSLFIIFLCRLFSKYQTGRIRSATIRQTRMMMLFFVILFLIRSFFSREILYSPTFISGLGILAGYYLFKVRNGYFLNHE